MWDIKNDFGARRCLCIITYTSIMLWVKSLQMGNSPRINRFQQENWEGGWAKEGLAGDYCGLESAVTGSSLWFYISLLNILFAPPFLFILFTNFFPFIWLCFKHRFMATCGVHPSPKAAYIRLHVRLLSKKCDLDFRWPNLPKQSIQMCFIWPANIGHVCLLSRSYFSLLWTTGAGKTNLILTVTSQQSLVFLYH